jgi:hypothetical protein
MNKFLEAYPLNYLDELVTIPRLIGQVLQCKPPDVLLANIKNIVDVLEQLLRPSGLFEVSQIIYNPPNHDFMKLLSVGEWIFDYIHNKYKCWAKFRGFIHECLELNSSTSPMSYLAPRESLPCFISTPYDNSIFTDPALFRSLEWFERTHSIGLLHWKIQRDIKLVHPCVSREVSPLSFWIFPAHGAGFISKHNLYRGIKVFNMDTISQQPQNQQNTKTARNIEKNHNIVLPDGTTDETSGSTSVFKILHYTHVNSACNNNSIYCVFNQKRIIDKASVTADSILNLNSSSSSSVTPSEEELSNKNNTLVNAIIRKTNPLLTVEYAPFNASDLQEINLCYYIIITWAVCNGLDFMSLHAPNNSNSFVITSRSEVRNIDYDSTSSLFNYTKEKILATETRLVHNIEGYISRFETNQYNMMIKPIHPSLQRGAITITEYATTISPDFIEDASGNPSVKADDIYISVEYFINRRLMILWKQNNTFGLQKTKKHVSNPSVVINDDEVVVVHQPETKVTNRVNGNSKPDELNNTSSRPPMVSVILRQIFKETEYTVPSGHYLSHFFRHDAGITLKEVNQLCPKNRTPLLEKMFRFWSKPAAKNMITENKIELKWSLIEGAIDLPLFIKEDISITESIVDIKNKLAQSILTNLKLAQRDKDIDEIIRIRLGIVVLLLDPDPIYYEDHVDDSTTATINPNPHEQQHINTTLVKSISLLVPFVFGTGPIERKTKYRRMEKISSDTGTDINNDNSSLTDTPYACNEWTFKEKTEKLLKILSCGLLVPTFKRIYFNFTFDHMETPLFNFFCPSEDREPLLSIVTL